MDSISALGYSSALYEIGVEENLSEQYKNDLQMVCDSFKSNPDLLNVLNHPKIDKEEKKQLIERIYSQDLSKTLINFMKLLLDKSRFNSIFNISKAYCGIYNDVHGIEIAHVYCAKMLSDDEIKNLKDMLEKKLNKTVEMKVQVDTTLLAGLRIKIKDEIIDNSAKNRLSRLKKDVMQVALES